MKTLHEKRVLITGASGSLGRAVVEACLAVGAHVVAGARRRTRLDELRAALEDHERLDVAEVDITDVEGASRLARSVADGGGLDGVVHCAGAFAYGPLQQTSPTTIQQVLTVNAFGTAMVLRAAAQAMADQDHGSIVVITADRALEPAAQFAIYGAAKAAATHLVQATALEHHGTGLRVNAILPGTIDTEANRLAMPDANPAHWASPRSIARTAVWLLGEDSIGTSGALIRQPGF